MRSIDPGQSIVYEHEAKHSGIFMYHCGTGPALHHIGMGMYGAIIIDPPDLPPVDREFVFVQSEIYEAPAGQVADVQKMADEDWDAIVFNGAVNQYKDRPIEVGVGERIRAWVLDDGPSENSSFHVVGTIFDTAFKEGAYLLEPSAASGGAQALGWSAGPRLAAGAGRVRRVHVRRRGSVSDRDPQVRQRRQGRARALQSRRRRARQDTGPGQQRRTGHRDVGARGVTLRP